MLLSLSRPQGGACCGLSSLRLCAQNFHCSWQQLGRAASFSEGAPPREPGVPGPASTPLLPTHQGLGSSKAHFPYNLERQLGQRQEVPLRTENTLRRKVCLLPHSSHEGSTPCSSQLPLPHNPSLHPFFPCLVPTSPQSPTGLLTSILCADPNYSHPVRHSKR